MPSCDNCNKGASKDDEYLRAVLVIRRDNKHPAATKLLDSVHRGLARPKARGMLTRLLQDLHRVAIVSPRGLYLGHASAYNVDLLRLSRVADRIVRGLFFKEYGEPLPKDYDVRSYADSGLRDLDADLRSLMEQTVDALLTQPPRVLGNGVFEYWHQATPEDSATTAWLLRFYQVEPFFCMTAPGRLSTGRSAIRR